MADSNKDKIERIKLLQAQIKEEEKILALEEKRRKQEERRRKINEDITSEFKSFAAEFRKLSPSVKNQLGSTKEMSGVYAQLSTRAAREAAIAKNNTGIVKQNAEIRKEALKAALDNLSQQASAAAQAQDELLGITQYERERLDLETRRKELGNENVDQLIAASRQTELLSKKTEILQDMSNSLPGPIKEMLGFAKGLRAAFVAGAAPLFIIAGVLTAAFKSFSDLDEAAKEFRETTGLTNSQMEGIKSDANEIVGKFSELGVNAKDVFNTVAALKSEFSDVADFSQETTAALTVLSANFGVSADNAAKVQGVLEQVSGLSSETAASVQLQVANMAKVAGVAPAKVMADIAESAEIASTLFKGDTVALAKNAIEARRLGTNLKSVAETAEKLLDFEGGIEEELTAATFVGGQFNLSRARALAFEGKIVEAQKETLAQIQRSGDFRKKDYFTQQQLAKAAGMSVEEINKQLNAQEKLNSLSDEQRKMAEDAINAGLDISNINKEDLATQVAAFSTQQEQQATLEKLQNAFLGIASTVGSVLTPLLDALIPILQLVLAPVQMIAKAFGGIKDIISSIFDPTMSLKDTFAEMGPIASGIAVALTIAGAAVLGSLVPGLIRAGIAAAAQLPALISAAVAAITSASAMTLGIGAVAIIGGIVAAVAAMKSAQKAGDLFSPADGKTQVSTKEGGLFELSPNDDLIAAPGAGKALNGESGGGVNLSALAAPMQAMVNEVKALRADLAAGKIAVYMDAQKVTNGVSMVVDQSARNSYNLGTV